MKTIKPNNMALTYNAQILDGKDVLSIGLFATFGFDTNGTRLLEDDQVWEVARANLDEDEVLDLGAPKPRGEFLVYGSCYSEKPVEGLGVHVSVGDFSKTLVVMGDRHWTKLGASQAVPFTQIPISYHNAFGGIGYANNPVGKGFAPGANGQIELPNIEDPKQPITQKSDRPQPVSFAAYPIMWPQRQQYMGKVDANYMKESWPHLPKGTNPELFNTAPTDQRLNGFFRGDETFSIKNMHKEKPVQDSVLPGLRARVFVVQNDAPDKFKEVDAKAETLWLFPNHEVGSLLYRANVEVADDEHSDITNLYAVWEDLAEEPKPAEFYYKQMMDEINPPEEELAEDTQIDPEEEIAAEEAAIEEASAEDVTEVKVTPPPAMDPEMEKSLKEFEKIEAQMREQLKSMNVANPDEAVKKYMAELTAAPATPPDMATILKQMEAQTADMTKKYNISEADIAKTIATANTPPASPAPVSETLAKLRGAGINDPEFEKNLTELDKMISDLKPKTGPNVDMTGQAAEAMATANEATEVPPEAEKEIEEKPLEEPTLKAEGVTVEDVIKQYDINKDLTGLDLTGLDLSGLDLREAIFNNTILEKTVFKKTNLEKAVFNNSRMNGTDFSKSSLNSVLFNETYAESVQFNDADLTLAIFSDSNFTASDFTAANLTEVGINQTTFEESIFANVQAEKLTANVAKFSSCDLSNANFAQASLVRSDLSSVIVNDTNFTELYAPELKLEGAVGTGPCFERAQLSHSRADEETLLHQANFKSAKLNDVAWGGIQLPEADFTSANLDDGYFSGGDFSQSKFELASAKNANFSKAQLVGCDLNRINLFQGSLGRANVTGANFAYSNLFGVDVYKAKFGNTNLEGANMKRTLFAAMDINVDKM